MSVSVSQAIVQHLEEVGSSGASLTDIYGAVREKVGEVPSASIRAALYNRLPGVKSGYRPRFERIVIEGRSRYRLLHASTSVQQV
jgi:hypothetical protein